jgi:cell division protein FtsB
MSATVKQVDFPVTYSILSLLLIYSTIGSIAITPAAIGVLLVLQIKALQIFNATVKELKAQREQREKERELLEQEKSQLLCEAREICRELKANLVQARGNAERAQHAKKTLKADLVKTTKEIKTLSSQVETLKEDIDELSAANNEFAIENDALTEEKKELESENEDLSSTLKKLEQENESLRLRNKELRRKIKSLQSELEEDLQDISKVDPRSLDPLEAGFTCIGLTKKGTRCGIGGSFISNASKRTASSILNEMRSADPGQTLELRSLRILARAMLCPRWHTKVGYDQTDIIAEGWYKLLADARAALELGQEQKGRGQNRLSTPAKSRPTQYFSGSAKSSSSSTPGSSTFSARSSPSTAATTPESDDDSNSRFGVDYSPTPFRFQRSKPYGTSTSG